MKAESLYLAVLLGFAGQAHAGEMQRIGHTTLLPMHTSPVDKGMYAAAIDPVTGYAYFVGTYLSKLDITGNLPVQVCPAFYVGQYTQGTLDHAAGYVYFTKAAVNRYNVGAGTNAPSFVNALSLAAGAAQEMVIDDSDPNPANHYGYVICSVSAAPATVAKVALGTFTELNSISLANGQSNFFFGGAADSQKGYCYFPGGIGTSLPFVVKIKMTPGTNAPIYQGAVTLGTTNQSIDGGCIDTVHGYAYYGTYDSNTNNPGIVYKVKLGDGDAPPTLVGRTVLKAGEGRLSAAVADPVNGFVYFANDNTYPGDITQLSMNGTNAAVEVKYFALQGGTNSATPPNGTSAANLADDGTNLPFGEVFFRSAIFDPIRGCAYFGQDSRPNQVVKMQLAQLEPITLTKPLMTNGAFQFTFTNIMGANFTAVSATNVTQSSNTWTAAGSITETSPGQYQFTDPQPAAPQGFYRVHSQ